MKEFHLTDHPRIIHALVMAVFGLGASLVLTVHPFVPWLYEDSLFALLVIGPAVVAILGNFLWKHTWLLDRPLLTGCLLMLNASIGISGGMNAVQVFVLYGVFDPLDVLLGGLLFGIWGVVLTFPLGPILGVAMACISEWLQRRLGVREDPNDLDPDAPWP